MKKETLIIQEALPEHATQVAALYRILVDSPHINVLPQRIRDIADDQNSYLYVAVRGGKVVGSVFVALCLDPMYGFQPFAVVENIVVSPESRISGVGTALP
jgi:GNAT superfamily N-acetyltransferase